jgi:hypothetical protein
MKVEVGKAYVTRDGEHVMIIQWYRENRADRYLVKADKRRSPPYKYGVNIEGKRFRNRESSFDLVAEVTE